MISKILAVILFASLSASAQYSSYDKSSINAANYPVIIPAGATAFTSLEQQSGWNGDSTFSVSGANAPAVCQINPGGSGNPCPGAGTPTGGTYSGGGGGSTMILQTTPENSLYTGWMAKKNLTTSGQFNNLKRITYQFDSVTSIQAFEVGRRSSNASQVTDNGQTQLVPIGGGLLEFDIASGGASWIDTGCRFPTFIANALYSEELYWVNDPSGALSLKYVSLNGTICVIPLNLQHIAGVVETPPWAADAAVVAWQPDAKPGTTPYNATVTMSFWLW
jgi:hypothetical protein